MVRLLDPSNPYFIAAIVCALAYALLWYWVRNDIKKQYAKEMGLDQKINKRGGGILMAKILVSCGTAVATSTVVAKR